QLVALVKPQFEAGRERVGKGGVVRDPEVHRDACERTASWVAAQPSWTVVGIVESPILGPRGNREFLLYARRSGEGGRCRVLRHGLLGYGRRGWESLTICGAYSHPRGSLHSSILTRNSVWMCLESLM